MAVTVQRRLDGVAIVALARDPVNALDVELVDAIADAVLEQSRQGAAGIVLTGNGRCFSAGIDTKAAASYGPVEREAAISKIDAMLATICAAPMPLVAAVNGHAFGGGLVLALACDVRVCARGEHRLALNEAQAGVPFPLGALALVKHELDPSVVRELCLTCRSVDAQEALSLRVVDELVEPYELLERACTVALTLASFPAYAQVKQQIRGGLAAELRSIAGAQSAARGAAPAAG